MKYTPEKFFKIYGNFTLNWPYDITHVIVIENIVEVYKDERLLSSFPIILYHDGVSISFVIHGKYKGYGPEGLSERFSVEHCTLYTECIYCLGHLHSEDGPSFKRWYPIGTKYQHDWFLNNLLHRENGPACQQWSNTGLLQKEIWFLNGKIHRDDGPAYVGWHDNKILEEEIWYWHGDYHRENEPAIQTWDKKGNILEQKWYVYDVEQESILTKRARG